MSRPDRDTDLGAVLRLVGLLVLVMAAIIALQALSGCGPAGLSVTPTAAWSETRYTGEGAVRWQQDEAVETTLHGEGYIDAGALWLVCHERRVGAPVCTEVATGQLLEQDGAAVALHLCVQLPLAEPLCATIPIAQAPASGAGEPVDGGAP